MQGDRTTPEGIYRIIKKKGQGETKYPRALLINYPNEEDKRRFDHAKRAGIIPQNARIGNLIEIHGHGGKGSDWTDGCIALTDNDMEILYRACSEGTRVTIVGSLESLDELFPGL